MQWHGKGSTAWAVILYILQSFIQHVNTDTFASTTELRLLLASEVELLEAVEFYIGEEEKRLKELKELLALQRENLLSPKVDNLEEYITHPVNSYHLIKHWYQITNKVVDQNNVERFQTRLQGSRTPYLTEVDMIGATNALLRLQRTYNISTQSLSRGDVYEHQAAAPLGYDDFYSLGVAAQRTGDYGLAAEWLQLSLSGPEDAVYKPDVLMELAQTHFVIGDYEEAAKVADEIRSKQPDPHNETTEYRLEMFKSRNETFYVETQGRGVPTQTVNTWERNLPFWKSNYEILCRGDYDFSVISRRGDVTCLIRNPHNYYAWAKEEILSVDPRVSLVYDVINDRESDKIKELATPSLFRAKVGDPSKAYSSEERVSKVAWLWDQTSYDGFIPTISKRIEYITGLSTKYRELFSSAEPFQVVNYGMGGQYEPHVDFYETPQSRAQVPSFILNTGDRVSTFMLYLSDVEAGGSTVFPQINIRVPPVKNAAAFWYNIRRSGELDQRTQHAGCPVLLGEKWVANKWIREYGQEFRRPCGLSDQTRDLNGYDVISRH